MKRHIENTENDTPYAEPFVDKCPQPIGSALSPHENDAKRSKHETFAVSKSESLTEKSFGPLMRFPKQRLALKAQKDLSSSFEDVRVFSLELDRENGEREFIVSTLSRFWFWYTHGAHRNLYELITEDTPCRLFFDLEYNREHNPDANPMECYDHFVRCACSTLKEMYSLDVEAKDFLALDSSTDSKFSCHLIAHLPDGRLFPNASAIRPFACKLRDRLLIDPPHRLRNADGKETVLLDQAVYSRNRNFRLFLSSKRGKDVFLTHASYCKFYGVTAFTEHQIFLDSICIPQGVAKISKDLILDVPTECRDLIGGTIPGATSNYAGFSSDDRIREGSGPSPFPLLDEFLLAMLRKWKSTAFIRQWKLTKNADGKPVAITYYPGGCRYCFNIGRQHKSNGVFWTVNLIRMEMWQRCFDPDCRDFESNRFPLPTAITQAVRSHLEMENDLDRPAEPVDVVDVLNRSAPEINQYFDQWDGVFEE